MTVTAERDRKAVDGAGAGIEAQMRALGQGAKQAAAVLANAPAAAKTAGLRAAAAALRDAQATILDANARDLDAAHGRGLTDAFIDRLTIGDRGVQAMAAGLEAVADFPDPVGAVLAEWDRPNGLKIARVRVPLGVIGVIYESRPNVTADAGGLCVKAGNAAILRGGSESVESSRTIAACLQAGLEAAGLPRQAVQLVPTTDREAVGVLLRLSEFVDVIVPRGGRSLIERVQRESRIPVFAHLDGLCHTYIHEAADPAMARAITVNAKMRRTGVCGATETLLIDRAVAGSVLPPILDDLAGLGCELRGDPATQALDRRVLPAEDTDWDTEYLDAILSIRQVDGLEQAIAHIERHGSHHTECIITGDASAAAAFFARVDSGILLHNASTQYADGGEFGMGAEIGISTGKMHARGPVGAEQLTSYKYLVRGTGQVRP